jgi:CubicO group peptidase (beta-lactamase class C family)
MVKRYFNWAKCLVIWLLMPFLVEAQITSTQIDLIVKTAMDSFQVPGVAVAVVKDGMIVHAKGYGKTASNSQMQVNEHTLFGMASNTKVFTCVALAQLVDNGLLKWEDPVVKYIPELTIKIPFINAQLSVLDLVTHRSGLTLGYGDLLFFPEGRQLSYQDVINALAHFDWGKDFRSKYQYNNVMYIVAGDLIQRLSGQSYDDYIATHILKPLGMQETFMGHHKVPAAWQSNYAKPHINVNGTLQVVQRDWHPTANPAGGLVSNIQDMAKWVKVLMNGFKYDQSKALISERQAQVFSQIQMPLPIRDVASYNTRYNGYSLGLNVTDINGYKQLSHTGGLLGMVTQVSVIPELQLGIIVLTNQQSGEAFTCITNTIKDAYVGYAPRQWVAKYAGRYQQKIKAHAQLMDSLLNLKPISNPLQTDRLLGTYGTDWFGDVVVKKQGKGYRVEALEQPAFRGSLRLLSNQQGLVIWDNRTFEADVYFEPHWSANGKLEKVTLKPVSEITDFSFDFEDVILYPKF